MTEQTDQSPRSDRTARMWRAAALAGSAAGLMLLAYVPGEAHKPNPADAVSEALAHNQIDAAISAGEAALATSPRDASLRAALGHAYMRAGRFESAAAVLADAQALGDNSPRTALTLALCDSAIGKGHDAIDLLDTARAGLPAADFGLALALAGETARGVSVLNDALKSGDPSPRLRQNLAYAYALDGRWADARNVVESDLPADKVDSRITQWAATAQPEAYRARVAALVNAPMRGDAGLPAVLALNASPAAPQLAEATPPAPTVSAAVPAAAEPAPVAAPAPVQVAAATPAPVPSVSQPVVEQLPAFVQPTLAHVIHARPAPAEHAAASLAHAAPARHAAPAHLAAAHWVAKPQPALANGNRAVQLGAFSSKAAAARARAHFARNATLAHHGFVITTVTLGHRSFWRVAVTGFSDGSARNACASLRAHGTACFAQAMPRAMVGHPAPAPAHALALATPRPGGAAAHARHK